MLPPPSHLSLPGAITPRFSKFPLFNMLFNIAITPYWDVLDSQASLG